MEKLTSATLRVNENADPPVAATVTAITVTTGAATGNDIMVMDAAAQTLRYTIEGADRAAFTATGNDDGTRVTRTVTITPKANADIDHEAKSSLSITLKATDPFGQAASIPVTINVTDQPEKPKITGPKTVAYEENGKTAVATFMAEDEDENQSVTWNFSTENGDGADHAQFEIAALTGVLTFKKSPNYEAANDGGLNNVYEVTVQATTVGLEATDEANMATATQLVRVKVTDAAEAPEFSKTTDTLTIEEDKEGDKGPDRPIGGDAVEAEDPDGGADMPTYSLSGSDADSFHIVPGTGQIVTKAVLDYETKKSYMVIVTATDRADLTDTIEVTIEVLDVDERPDITAGGISVSGPASMDYAENGMGAVGTYEVQGPNAANATWSLEGPDAGDFRLDGSGMSRMLKFSPAPNYEMAADADTNNVYMVTVKATDRTDSTMMDSQEVTVTVTNEEETGEVTLWASATEALTMAPQVGDTITGAVMDPDGGVTGETWQWSRTMTPDMMDSWMPIVDATDAAYMVAEGDTDHYLRVMATYTDAVGTDTVMAHSPATMMVGAEAADPLLTRYDDDKDGYIQLGEARVAVGDYFGPPKGLKLSLADTRKVVGLYFEYRNRPQ